MANVSIKNINKSFNDKEVLKNINMDIQEGSFISLLGPSGCGKSTLLKIIAGLIKSDTGQIYFDKEDFTNIETNKRNAIIVFQDYSLFPHMTVFENIAYGLKFKKMKKNEVKQKVEKMLEVISLLDKAKSFPNQLSGGQQQRVAIARALILEPRVLLLDEPFSGLDNNLKIQMRSFVLKITKDFKITTLMVTHDKEEAFSMSDKVAIMLDKEISQFDEPKNIFTKPNSVLVAKFLSTYNIFEGTINNTTFSCPLGDFECTLENKETANMIINYEYLEFDSDGINGIVTERYYSGSFTHYVINCNGTILKGNFKNDIFNVNDNVNIKIKDYYIL